MAKIVQILFQVLLRMLFYNFCKANVARRFPLILVSMDGVGWQFVGTDLTNTPNFDFVAETGVKAKNMLTVNPTSTFPTHTTFVTGLWPESHGIVGNDFYDPVYDESFYLETDCTNFDPKFYNDSEPIWLTMEKRGRKTGAYFWPSSTSYEVRPTHYASHVCRVNCNDYRSPKKLQELRNKKGRNHCKFDWENDPYSHRVQTVIKWLISEEPPELVLLYFEKTDFSGHAYGPNDSRYWKSVEQTDRNAVGNLICNLRKADLLDKVNLIFVSDHSMVEANNKKQVDLYEFVDKSSWHEPGLWVQPDRLEELYANLSRVNSSHMKVYKREDTPESYHSKHNRRYPPLVVESDLAWTLRWSRYDAEKEGEWSRGSHGWPPYEELAAIFYARGPSFKEGYSTSKSLRAVDLYPLICHLLGLEPLPHNGSLDNMREFLRLEPLRNNRHTKIPPTEVETSECHDDLLTFNIILLFTVILVKVLSYFSVYFIHKWRLNKIYSLFKNGSVNFSQTRKTSCWN